MKGIELPFSAVIGGFFILMLIVVLYLIFVARFYQMGVWVAEFDSEIKTINLAQILLSHENLTYVKDGVVQRGIFDEEKLDKEIKGAINPININVGYPGYWAEVAIQDGITGKKWNGMITPWLGLSPLELKVYDCLNRRMKIDWDMIFRLPPLSPWYSQDLAICWAEFAEAIIPAARIFPIAIKSGNEIHPGNMTVAGMILQIGQPPMLIP